uniref:Uncharacterized protein n=1 Tax=Cyprinodon variegatus TaxID=28743 RepID=A0A3Q2CL63_CYPVA
MKHDGLFLFLLPAQVRNHTCARCAVKDSARAPTSSPTAESTAATGLSAALAVSTLSSVGWTCSATKRLNVAMEKLTPKDEPRRSKQLCSHTHTEKKTHRSCCNPCPSSSLSDLQEEILRKR